MFQIDMDEISIIEKDACISSIIGMMESFGISLDDIATALAKCRPDNGADDGVDAGVALDVA